MLNLDNKVVCTYAGIGVMFLAGFVTTATTAPPPTVRSVKAVIVEKGDAYVAAGYPENHRPFQDEFDKLWNKSTSKHQEMRPVALDALERIIGPIDRHYVVLRDRMESCTPLGVCPPHVVDGFDAATMDVEAGVLAMWGCGDDINDTVVPVLRLKPWPWGGNLTEAIAVSVPPTKGWKAERLQRKDFPPTLSELIPSMHGLVPPNGDIARVTSRDNKMSFFFLHWLTEISRKYAVTEIPLLEPPVLHYAIWPTGGC